MPIEDRLKRVLAERAASVRVTRQPWQRVQPRLVVLASQHGSQRRMKALVLAAVGTVAAASAGLIALLA